MYTDTVYLVVEPVIHKPFYGYGLDKVQGIKVTKMLRHRPDAKPGQTIVEVEVKQPEVVFRCAFDLELVGSD